MAKEGTVGLLSENDNINNILRVKARNRSAMNLSFDLRPNPSSELSFSFKKDLRESKSKVKNIDKEELNQT